METKTSEWWQRYNKYLQTEQWQRVRRAVFARDARGAVIAREGEYSPVVRVRIDKQNRGKTGDLQQVMRGEFFKVADMQMGA